MQHSKEGRPAPESSQGPTPLQPISCAKTKKYGPMKEQSKTSGKELSNEEIANLADGEFKTLVIKMPTDLIELGKKMKKQENQDGGVGRHTAPPPTTRPDGESNSKGDQHQGNRK